MTRQPNNYQRPSSEMSDDSDICEVEIPPKEDDFLPYINPIYISSRCGSANSSQDISFYDSDEDFESRSWVYNFTQYKSFDNNDDPNEKSNKNPPIIDSPPYQHAPSPFEIEDDEETPVDGDHVALRRDETDAIIDRLLNSCDGDLDDEFGEPFDPAVIKFEIAPEVKEPNVSGPFTLYSSDEEEEDDKPEIKPQVVKREDSPIVIDDDDDDDEVTEICSREPAKDTTADTKIIKLKKVYTLGRHFRPWSESTTETIAKVERDLCALKKVKDEDDDDDDEDVVFVPPNKILKPQKVASNGNTTSVYRGGGRPSTSKAALEAILMAPVLSHKAHKPRLIKPEPSATATLNRPSSSISPSATDYRVAFAEMEQLLSEDNPRNRALFANPAAPASNHRAMFKSNQNLTSVNVLFLSILYACVFVCF